MMKKPEYNGLNEYSKIINRFNRHFMKIDFIILTVLLGVEVVILLLDFVGGAFLPLFGFSFSEYMCDIILKTLAYSVIGGIVFGGAFIESKPGDELYENIPLLFCEYITIIINTVFYMFPVLQLMVLFAPLVSLIYNDQRIFKRLILCGSISTAIIGLSYQITGKAALPDFYIYNIFYVLFSFAVIYKLGSIIIIYEKEKETKFLVTGILNESLEEKNEILENDVNMDGLTRVNNFKSLSKITEDAIKAHYTTGASLIYCMLDIDNFKSVNDTYGHEFGNTVLKVLGGELKKLEGHSTKSKTLTVARYGGEEFGILFKNFSQEEAFGIVEGLRSEFKGRSYRETPAHFTFSAGMALYENDMDVTAFFKAADDKLYTAKQNGKDQTCA